MTPPLHGPTPALDLDGPVPIAVDISRLLRSTPALALAGRVPIGVDFPRLRRSIPPPPAPAALTPWLTQRADLFARIAPAPANPGLADDARAVAAAARHALAALPGGAA